MLSHYFSSQFLFGTGVILYSHGDRYLLIFNIILFLAGVLVNVLSSRKSKKNQPASVLLGKWASLLLTMGVLTMLWSVMREQGIVLLSSHIIVAGLYLITIIWALPIIKYQCTKYKVFAAEHKKLVEREKYLPR